MCVVVNEKYFSCEDRGNISFRMLVMVSQIHPLLGNENKIRSCTTAIGARSSIVGRGTMLQAGPLPVRVPDEVDFFNLPNPSSRTMALGSTQSLTEMSIRKLLGV
jgi:hypothetical protein